MGDCDRVREVLGLSGVCCKHCHVRGTLTPWFVQGLGKVRVCCTTCFPLMTAVPDGLPLDDPYGEHLEEGSRDSQT